MSTSVSLDTAVRFKNLFAGSEVAHGEYRPYALFDERAFVTVHGPATSHLWLRHLSGEQSGALELGIVPVRQDGTVLFGVIDVDRMYATIGDVAGNVGDKDLPLIVSRSKSGGSHLHCFAKQPISADLMNAKLVEMANLLGYPHADHFPSKIDVRRIGNEAICRWITMPYYCAMQEWQYAVYADGKARPMPMKTFLDTAEMIKMEESWFESAVLI